MPRRVDELVEHLLSGPADDDPIAEELRAWATGSPRFRAFADANRDKIRKKLRTATEAEARRDVRAELRVAHLLLGDRRIELAFEAAGSTRGGPDFAVTYRGDRPFNLEVTRRALRAQTAAHAAPLLAKLRQLPPGAPNALLVAIDGDGDGQGAAAFDVAAAVRALRARADAKDEEFFTRRALAGTKGFYERFLRLGAVLVLADDADDGDGRATLWQNRSARIAVPERALRACLVALRRSAPASGS